MDNGRLRRSLSHERLLERRGSDASSGGSFSLSDLNIPPYFTLPLIDQSAQQGTTISMTVTGAGQGRAGGRACAGHQRNQQTHVPRQRVVTRQVDPSNVERCFLLCSPFEFCGRVRVKSHALHLDLKLSTRTRMLRTGNKGRLNIASSDFMRAPQL